MGQDRSVAPKQIVSISVLIMAGTVAWFLHSRPPASGEGSPERVAAADGNVGAHDSSTIGHEARPHEGVPSSAADPANDREWLAPNIDPQTLTALLEDPPAQLDIFTNVEWTATNAWASIPDIGGPWSLARRECATEKLGFAGESCDYFVNVVVQRTAGGTGEVVAARAEFERNSLAGDPDVQLSGEASLASARCRNFARCLVSRGYANLVDIPLGPGLEGDLIALQIAGHESPKPARDGDRADIESRLDAAIEGTLAQLRMFEEDPSPEDLAWHFNVAMLRRALEYYRWLKTQV